MRSLFSCMVLLLFSAIWFAAMSQQAEVPPTPRSVVEIPKLTDAQKIEFLAAARDYSAAVARYEQAKGLMETQQRRIQGLVSKHQVPGYNFNAETLIYTPKPAPKP